MKQAYIQANLEVVRFDNEDVIVTSGIDLNPSIDPWQPGGSIDGNASEGGFDWGDIDW